MDLRWARTSRQVAPKPLSADSLLLATECWRAILRMHLQLSAVEVFSLPVSFFTIRLGLPGLPLWSWLIDFSLAAANSSGVHWNKFNASKYFCGVIVGSVRPLSQLRTLVSLTPSLYATSVRVSSARSLSACISIPAILPFKFLYSILSSSWPIGYSARKFSELATGYLLGPVGRSAVLGARAWLAAQSGYIVKDKYEI